MQRRTLYQSLWPILALLVLAALVGWTNQANAQPARPSTGVLIAQAHPDKAAPVQAGPAQIATDDHQINMEALGIRPNSRSNQASPRIAPKGGVVGTSNAWMNVSPDVISPTTGVAATLASGFTGGESVNYYLNGALAGTFAASSAGVLRIAVTAGSTEGYVTVEAQGVTSGKRTGGVFQIQNNAPQVPGVAVGPHAITSGNPFYIYAVGYPPTTTVQVALDNGTPTAYTTGPTGRLALNFPSITGGPGASVFNVYRTGVAGSMNGQSFEIRPDAGSPGDANPSRGLADRAVVNATTGGVVTLVGEGFQPNEPVTISGCANGATNATANGAVIAPLNIPTSASPAIYRCTATGGNSSYVVYGAILADSTTTNTPSGIVAPSSTISDGNPVIVGIDRFPANQTGIIYVDGTATTVFTTTATGFDTELIAKPAALGIHVVAAIANNGQVAIMPLWINSPALTTTPTGTAIGPTATLTGTPTTSSNTATRTSTATTATTTSTAPPSTTTVTATPQICPPFITQNTSLTPVTGDSIACADTSTGFTAENHYYRLFPMPNYVSLPVYAVTSVDLGIEQAAATAGSQVITVNLYNSSANPPTLASLGSPLASTTVVVPNQSNTLLNVPILAVVPGTGNLVVEVVSPDGQIIGNAFYLGANTAGQTGPSYIYAADCGLSEITDLADIGFGDVDYIMRVNGICTVPTATTTPTGGIPTVTRTATTTAGVPTVTRTATTTATSILPTVTLTVLPPTVSVTVGPGTSTATQTVTVTATACPTYNFSDVQPSDYFYEPVQYLACHGVIGGYSDGTFRPYNNTTRGQMAKIVALGFDLPIQTPAAGGHTYEDVMPTDTFYPYIETLAARQIAGGYNCGSVNPQTNTAEPCNPPENRPYFRPGNFITRGQLVKLVVIAASQQFGWDLLNPATPTFSDAPPNSTFYEYIETAVCHGVINGYNDGTFRPGANAFRGQISKIVYLAVTGSAPNCVNPTVTATATP